MKCHWGRNNTSIKSTHFIGVCEQNVKHNEYYCSVHKNIYHCNFHHADNQCKNNSYYQCYCIEHYYMCCSDILLSITKVSLSHPMCDRALDISTYLIYNKNDLCCKYRAEVDTGAYKYYQCILPRWLTMYLVFKYFLNEEAHDIFVNVANYYISL